MRLLDLRDYLPAWLSQRGIELGGYYMHSPKNRRCKALHKRKRGLPHHPIRAIARMNVSDCAFQLIESTVRSVVLESRSCKYDVRRSPRLTQVKLNALRVDVGATGTQTCSKAVERPPVAGKPLQVLTIQLFGFGGLASLQ